MGTFFQVCVGAPLADDHAHNRERGPLNNVQGIYSNTANSTLLDQRVV